MAQFIIECSNGILADSNQLLDAVHDAAKLSELFLIDDIKVRINCFEHYRIGAKKEPFIHIVSYMYPGRTEQQKFKLSESIIFELIKLLPSTKNISMDIREIDRSSYRNRVMVESDGA